MYFYFNKSTRLILNVWAFLYSKGVLSMVKVWKDADKVVKSNVGLEGKYEEIKKVMEEAPNGVDIKPMSKFRKDTRVEKY